MSDIGTFLLRHDAGPRWEQTDVVSRSMPDVRQDALERTMMCLHRRGEAITTAGDDEQPAFLDEHAGLAASALQYAFGEARREQYGRAKRLAWDEAPHEFARQDETEARTSRLEQVMDQWTQDCFERIDADHAGQLRKLYDEGNKHTRLAIHLMCEAQVLANLGLNMTNSMRSQLKRLRKQTGLALDTSML